MDMNCSDLGAFVNMNPSTSNNFEAMPTSCCIHKPVLKTISSTDPYQYIYFHSIYIKKKPDLLSYTIISTAPTDSYGLSV
jgi:hypothetical protein